MSTTDVSGFPAPTQSDVDAFEEALQLEGFRPALSFLNKRTPHRFTGVFRFDGDMLRNIALVDKWDARVDHGDDVPLEAAYCAHLHRTGEPLEVANGASDERTPWMKASPVVSYCGSVILDADGAPWGALCHFDTAPCDAKNSEMPLLIAAARILYEQAVAAV